MATRLSEGEAVTVGVLAPGKDRSGAPRILIPGLYDTLSGDPGYDWKLMTAPQVRYIYPRVVVLLHMWYLCGSVFLLESSINDALGVPGWLTNSLATRSC